MSEIKWYVQVVKDYRTDQIPSFLLMRAHSWQEAYDSIRKDRFSDVVWSLYPIEPDGSFFDCAGVGAFQKIDQQLLIRAGFYEVQTIHGRQAIAR